MIREMNPSDAKLVLTIYEAGIATRNATFETRVPSWEVWDQKHHPFCRFVYLQDHKVSGWVAISPVSNRDCYRGVAEISIYVDTHSLGRGIGSALMAHVIPESEKHGIWSLYASMFPENMMSQKLHLRYGFREVGVRKKIAQLDGIWRDTLIMERRSTLVGL